MEKLLTDNAGHLFAALSYDQRDGWVFVQWFGPQPDDQVQRGCQAMYEMILGTGSQKILNDGSLVTGSWNSANPWIESSFAEKIIAAGLRYYAHVVPHDLLAKLSAVDLHHRIGDITHMRAFLNIDEARAWLESI